jgi:uncharacterized protein YacL
MLINVFRAIFFVVIIAVMLINLGLPEISGEAGRYNFFAVLYVGAVVTLITFLLDILTPKKSLAALAGVFFGLLVGIFISWAILQVIDMVNEIYRLNLNPVALKALKWIFGICICYLTITIVMRTKDDVRFVIPYVEFAKQSKGARPLILDTSAIIDGRITDLYQNKLFDAPLVVPRFVLNELQLLADSSDKLKRNRGRRGLDILKTMQNDPIIDIEIDETVIPKDTENKGVDQKLVVFTKMRDGRMVTTDYNLSKVAQVNEVDVLNINNLAASLKTIALPGEFLKIKIIKPGEEADQGIGYLDDGTMVVVEGARDKIGKEINLSITSSLQTSAGKMIFGKFEGFPKNNNNNKTKNNTAKS